MAQREQNPPTELIGPNSQALDFLNQALRDDAHITDISQEEAVGLSALLLDIYRESRFRLFSDQARRARVERDISIVSAYVGGQLPDDIVEQHSTRWDHPEITQVIEDVALSVQECIEEFKKGKDRLACIEHHLGKLAAPKVHPLENPSDQIQPDTSKALPLLEPRALAEQLFLGLGILQDIEDVDKIGQAALAKSLLEIYEQEAEGEPPSDEVRLGALLAYSILTEGSLTEVKKSFEGRGDEWINEYIELFIEYARAWLKNDKRRTAIINGAMAQPGTTEPAEKVPVVPATDAVMPSTKLGPEKTPAREPLGRMGHAPQPGVENAMSKRPTTQEAAVYGSTDAATTASVPQQGTENIIDGFSEYFKRLREFPVLSFEQVIELAKCIEAGLFAEELLRSAHSKTDLSQEFKNEAKATDEELLLLVEEGKRAKTKMIEHNLRLVVFLSKKFQNKGVPTMDLIQEGNVALIHALEKFDYKRGRKFSTYAKWWIEQAMSVAIMNKTSNIRLPRHITSSIMRMTKAQNIWADDLGRLPTDSELADYLGISIRELTDLKDIAFSSKLISLSAPFYGHEVNTIEDTISNRMEDYEDAVADAQIYDTLRHLVSKLPAPQRIAITRHYGLDGKPPQTYNEIGLECHISGQAVRQNAERALARLRDKGILHVVDV